MLAVSSDISFLKQMCYTTPLKYILYIDSNWKPTWSWEILIEGGLPMFIIAAEVALDIPFFGGIGSLKVRNM